MKGNIQGNDQEASDVETRHGEALRETLDRLCAEVAELRASRERLVLAADADRRALERELHDGVQQHLVALAVNLQRASALVVDDLAVAKQLLDEMECDVERALDAAAHLAERIYPPLLEPRELAVTLRAAAVSAATPASVNVARALSCTPEVALTIYLCWIQALRQAGQEGRPKVTVCDEEGATAFEVVAEFDPLDPALTRLRDRVEALGGRLTIRSERGPEIRVAGSLPLSR
jgi:signal transduction histidine kinase